MTASFCRNCASRYSRLLSEKVVHGKSDVGDIGEDETEPEGVAVREGKDSREVVGEGIDMTSGWAGQAASVVEGHF